TVYVTGALNGEIRKVVVSSGQVTTLADSLAFVGYDAVAVGGDVLYATDRAAATINRFDLATFRVTTIAGTAGAWGVDDGIGAAARFQDPAGIVSDGNGHLYVSDFGRIRKIDLDTLSVTTPPLEFRDGVPFFTSPGALALDGAGN